MVNRREFVVKCGAVACSCMVARIAYAGADEKAKKMMMAACGLDCNTCGTRAKGCEGCHGPSDKVWSPDCRIRACCIGHKELSDCTECDHFPCDKVEAFEDDGMAHHKKAIAKLRKIREGKRTAGPPSGSDAK